MLCIPSRCRKTSSVIRKILKGIPIGIGSGVVFEVTVEIVFEVARGYSLGCALPRQLLHGSIVYHLLVRRQVSLAIALASFVGIELLGSSDIRI